MKRRGRQGIEKNRRIKRILRRKRKTGSKERRRYSKEIKMEIVGRGRKK